MSFASCVINHVVLAELLGTAEPEEDDEDEEEEEEDEENEEEEEEEEDTEENKGRGRDAMARLCAADSGSQSRWSRAASSRERFIVVRE